MEEFYFVLQNHKYSNLYSERLLRVQFYKAK